MKPDAQTISQDKDSFQLLEKAFASLREAVFIIDAKTTRILNCNPAASQIFGYRKEEMLGQTTDFLHVSQEKLEEFRKSLFAAVEKGGSLELPEFQMKRKNGEVFFTNHSVMSLENDQGKRIGWVSVVRDITERKRAEEELKSIGKRYLTLFEETSDGVWMANLRGEFFDVNAAYCRMSGYTREELIGTPISKVEAVESPQEILDHIKKIVETSGSHRFESKHRRKDGSVFDVDITTAYLEREPLIAGFARDITSRKQAEEALRKSELHLARAQEIAHLGSWELDVVNNRLSWSNEVYRIFGLKPQEFGATYEAFLESVHPDDRAAVDEAYSGSLREGRDNYEIEHRIIRKSNGEVRVVHERCEHIRDESGQIIRSIGMVHDLTERKRAEEELRQSRDQLETRVSERTAKLQESEYRLRELTVELMNAQETERKRIAHELHDSLAAQLAAIKYRLERALQDGKIPQASFTLEEIIQDIQRAEAETRRIMANLRPSVLDDIGIVAALSWLCRETQKAYLTTIIEYAGNVQEEEVPEGLKIIIFRIVQESITNATRHGKPTRISVSLDRIQPWLRLRVEDNGKGFDSLKLGEKSETGGIGLNSMQQRVDSTGGIFSISSAPGQGTTVKAEWRLG